MPWRKTREDRQRDAKVYGREYKRDRGAARRRAAGRCEQCGHKHARLECDHTVPTTQGGGHGSNLRMLCKGPGTCRCHEKKTAREGGGFRSARSPDPQPRPRTSW